MSKLWYYSIGGIEQGPVSSSALRDLAKRGDLQPDDFVRKEGESHWRSAGRFKGLFENSVEKKSHPSLSVKSSAEPPSFLKYIKRHWKDNSGTWFVPVVLSLFLIPLMSLSKTVVGWKNLAGLIGCLYIISGCSLLIYFLLRVALYLNHKGHAVERKSRLARFTHDVAFLTIFLLTPVLALEYFTPRSGMLVSAVPKLQKLQEDIFGKTELPFLCEGVLVLHEKTSSDSGAKGSGESKQESQDQAKSAIGWNYLAGLIGWLYILSGCSLMVYFISRAALNVRNKADDSGLSQMKNSSEETSEDHGMAVKELQEATKDLQRGAAGIGRSIKHWWSGLSSRGRYITIGVIGLLLLIAIFFQTEAGNSVVQSPGKVDAVLSPKEVDEEFKISASQKGMLGTTKAEMLIDFRNTDNYSWKGLDGIVDFQMQDIKTEYEEWKQSRIAAGDRFK